MRDRKKLTGAAWAFGALSILVLALMLSGSLHRSSGITLPDSGPLPGEGEAGGDAASSTLTVVEVTPETVQAAIGSLSRPEAYQRTVTVEQLWSGGSGRFEAAAAVSGPWTRTDRTLPGGRIRHTITDGRDTYIWYDEEKEVYAVPAGRISADDEQSIPTYEDILQLPPDRIVTADYRALEGLRCIYAETAVDSAGYRLRYWVSVDTGLLAAAEKLLGEETVYRMQSLTVEESAPPASSFTLPDGRVLLETAPASEALFPFSSRVSD